MNGFPEIFARRNESAEDSRRWVWLFVLLLLVGAWYFTDKAAQERDQASRQQACFGMIVDCQNSARSAPYCHYTFSVNDKQYMGFSPASSSVHLGQIQNVYYDSQQPMSSSLEELSKSS